MSAAENHAVFLSYASQDAEAARRIAESLRGSGVEVWFDQNELVGGDQWDQKIRKQIKECALLIPIISAATQARTEGYFRLEWRLADQRTHLMAKGRPFLLPVVIDDTRDADAQVPDSFTDVQWTRLLGGQTSSAFCARVGKLLGHGSPVGAASRRDGLAEASQPESRHKAAPTRTRGWVAGILTVVTVAALAIWQPWKLLTTRSSPALSPSNGLPATVFTSEARKLVAKAWEQLNKAGRSRPELEMADRLCQQAAELDPNDADVWAAWSQVDTWYYYTNVERTPARREGASSKTARALRIAPDSYEARLAQACFLVREEPHEKSIFADEAERQLRRLLEERADEPRALFALGILLRNGLRHDEGALVFDRLARQPAFAATALSEKGFLRLFEGRFQEAGECADQSIALEPFYGNLALKTFVAVDWYGDLDQARDAVEMMPAAALMEDYGAGAAYDVYWRRREPDKMLRVLRALPREWLSSNNLSGPKQFYVGVAHRMAGRLDAARTEWRTALEVLNLRLQSDPNNSEWHFVKAKLLVWLGGNKADAEEHFRLAQDFAPDAWQKFGVDVERAILSGDVDGAIRVMEQSAKNGLRRATASALKTSPMYDPIRADPRFQALLARMEADPRLSPNARPSATANRRHVDDKSVAVLAFANLSDDKGNEYFSDGISEELLNVLAKIPGLKVTARTSAFFFKGKQVPLAEIAQQLGVAYIVEGSVRKQGDKVRITAQLIKAADGFHVWSDTFTRDLEDVFAVQDEIAGLIAQNLRLTMGANSPGAKAAINPEAFELYVQARQAWNLRTPEGFDRAEEVLNRALSLEPEFARAHAALSDVWVARGMTLGEMGQFGQRESLVMQRIIATAERAVALDPNSAEAHASLGSAYTSAWRLADATRTLRHAVELNSNYATGRQMLGRALLAQGFFAEGAAELARAAELDPLSHRIIDNNAIALVATGRPRGALAAAERALALMPDSVQAAIWRARSLSNLGRHEEAVAQARRVQDDGGIQSAYLVEVFTAAGLNSEAEGILATVDRKFPAWKFIGLVALGRLDEALAAMNPADMMPQFFYQANLDPVRDDPRFQQLLATLGLTEANARIQAWRAAHPSEMPEAKP